jgi:Leucine-rich repeat (LRR) protein
MDVFDGADLVAARVDASRHAQRLGHTVGALHEGHKDEVTAFVASVNGWAGDLDQAEDEQREEAALRIQQCWETDATMLDLRNLRLSTLPGGLWMLNRTYPGLRSGPQSRDRSIRHREAPEPEHASTGVRLRQLLLDGNRLRDLSDRIASLSSLRHLSIAHNRLTGLPDALKRLPTLSYLNVGANDLEALPDALGEMAALEVLRAHGCLLRWIPPSLGTLPLLRELDVSGNGLTTLPDAIRWLPTACVVRLHDNPLPERVRWALRVGPTAPIWMFDDKPPARFSRTLDEAAFVWLIAGADRCRGSLDAWRRIEDTHPAVARALTRWLDALGTLPEASNSDTRIAFRASVRDTLKQIEADASDLVRFFSHDVEAMAAEDAMTDAAATPAPGDDSVTVSADTDVDGRLGRRDVETRAQWARLTAALADGRDAAGASGTTHGADDADVARRDAPQDVFVVPGPMRDETGERALRRWIDRYVLAYPLLDCADVLHACRVAIDHSDRHGTLLPLPRAGSAQTCPPTESPQPIAPGLQVMSAEDLADCLRTVPSIAVGGLGVPRNRAERGNCIG